MNKILNHADLELNDARKHVLEIAEAGLQAIDTSEVLKKEISWDTSTRTLCVRSKNFCFSDYERVFFVAIGKCANDAATTIEAMFGDALTGGIVLDVSGRDFQKLSSRIGTHPLPSHANILATEDIVTMLTELTEKDLVLCVVSGGGSALLCSPFDTDCDTLAKITAQLMKKGADILEINTVRKHISRVQGGQLAAIAYPATVLGLFFSDVPGDDVSVIASGPLSLDATTIDDAESILQKYAIRDDLSIPGLKLKETPKEGMYFKNVTTAMLASSCIAINAMKERAELLGYTVVVEEKTVDGEARDFGEVCANVPLNSKSVLLYSGETTVTIKGKGIGGRNQETALSAMKHLNDDRVILSIASDGYDNTPAAGAIADALAVQDAKSLGFSIHDYLDRNDSHSFFKAIGGTVMTGRTGSNVADLIIILRS